MDAADIITTQPNGEPIPDLGLDDWYEGPMISRCSADGSIVRVEHNGDSAHCAAGAHRWVQVAAESQVIASSPGWRQVR